MGWSLGSSKPISGCFNGFVAQWMVLSYEIALFNVTHWMGIFASDYKCSARQRTEKGLYKLCLSRLPDICVMSIYTLMYLGSHTIKWWMVICYIEVRSRNSYFNGHFSKVYCSDIERWFSSATFVYTYWRLRRYHRAGCHRRRPFVGLGFFF
jgi:hypothetical protein